MRSVKISAPAKVNLGLAILGKRPDGYHDIDTIMAMIDLSDEITIKEDRTGDISITGMDDVPLESNLMTKAARLWSSAAGIDAGWQIDIIKRIPSPAGIGGGSSDAAAVLMALNALYGEPLTHQQLHDLAASIGSDSPFFLNGPCSRATGTGTDLRSFASPTGWVVLAIPRISTEAKTATLYGVLTPQDYGTSAMIDVVEQRVSRGDLRSYPLVNSFISPALASFTMLPELHQLVTEVTGSASLSGAGPSIYAIARSQVEADLWAEQLSRSVSDDIAIHTAQFLQSRPAPEVLG